jgi:hypothetical protein
VTHGDLVERAATWLNTMHCDPVLTGIASTLEIPDAIGWTSKWSHHGSIVIECKASRADFNRDKYKSLRFRSENGHVYKPRNLDERARHGMEAVWIPRMGTRRYFMCEPDVITAGAIAEYTPDHGLLYVLKRGVKVMVPAPVRANEKIDLASEIRLLRFALIHVRGNLCAHGCSVNMRRLAMWSGKDGITLPERS